jgi:hypothetical protein
MFVNSLIERGHFFRREHTILKCRNPILDKREMYNFSKLLSMLAEYRLE